MTESRHNQEPGQSQVMPSDDTAGQDIGSAQVGDHGPEHRASIPNERYFQVLLESIQDAVIILDKTGATTYVNPAYERILGFSSHERVGGAFYENVHPDDRPKAIEAFQHHLQNPGESLRLEMRVRRKDGEWLYIDAVGTGHFNNPVIRGLVVHLRDVTGTVKIREELRHKEEYFRNLIEKSADGIAILDAEGNITYESRSGHRILGYTAEELYGRNVLEFIHEDDRQRVQETIAGIISTPGATVSTDLRFRHHDGRWIVLEGTASNYLDDALIRGVVVNYRDITERRRAEEALRESEQRYRLLAENLSDVIWIMDTTQRYTYVSPSVEQLRGYTVEETMAQSLAQNLSPSSLETALALLAEQRERESSGTRPPYDSVTLEAEVSCKDGSNIWVENRVSFIYDEEGSVVGYLGVSHDISERKKAEEALRESEKRYRLLAENVSDVIWTMDRNMKYTYISPSIMRLRGFTVEEAMAQTLEENVAAESLTQAMHLDATQKAREEAGMVDPYEWVSIEAELTCKDGSTVWTENRINFLRDDEGNLIGYLGVSRDISEHKKAEEALRESEAKNTAIVEHAKDGVIIWQGEYVVFANKAVTDISGFSNEEITSVPYLEMLGPDKREEIRKLHEDHITGTLTPGNYQFTIRCKNGEKKAVEVSTACIQYKGMPAVVGIIRDMTDRKKAEEARIQHAAALAKTEALEQSRHRIVGIQEALRREIAQEIHGSVQNRLIVLMHKLREIQDQCPDKSAELADLHAKLADLVENQIRPISHRLYPSILKQGLVPALQSLTDHFENAIDMQTDLDKVFVSSERQNRNLIPDDIKLAVCRISEEALTNVIKHSGASLANLRLRYAPDRLDLEIADNGRGFDPQKEGRGIGLLMLQDYAEIAGGEFTVESTLGGGTRILASFPLAGNG